MRRLHPLWNSTVRHSCASGHTPPRPRTIPYPRCHSTAKPPLAVPPRYKASIRPLAFTFTTCAFAFAVWTYSACPLNAEAPPPQQGKSDSRIIRFDEVRQHGRDAPQKWVTRGSKVYDITDWIPNHPGGEVILRACGGAVDAYWDIFAIHQKQEVYDVLAEFYIGDVDPRDLVDGKVAADKIDDPFKHDPERDGRLIVHSQRPFNAETPPEELGEFLTPKETFYVRQHLWVPELNNETHSLVIELPDGEEREYSMDDLRQKFEIVTITATLQCSGNRRNHMTEGSQRPTNGLQWKTGAISNTEWTGVRLRDVLKDAGFPVNDPSSEGVKHAQFTGAEAYGASIPISKAVSPTHDAILAFAMNDQPLPADHGYPLRLIIPGTVAARSVKWIKRISLSEEESQSQWQQRDYKCFGPNVGKDPDWGGAPAIQDMPVQSAITSIRTLSTCLERDRSIIDEIGLEGKDALIAEGYSFAGGGRRIIRVDVSSDGGKTWHQAELLPDSAKGSRSWAWQRWRWVLPKGEGEREFVVKAVDEAYNTQPADYASTWNFRGNLTSAWHRVKYDDRRRS